MPTLSRTTVFNASGRDWKVYRCRLKDEFNLDSDAANPRVWMLHQKLYTGKWEYAGYYHSRREAVAYARSRALFTKEQIDAKLREYLRKHRPKTREEARRRADEIAEAIRLHEKAQNSMRRFFARAYRKDPTQHISRVISSRICRTLRGAKSRRHWEDIVGWSFAQFKQRVESLFEPDMAWDNFGEWHIDHIKPVASFTFTTADCPEFRECWALSNLMPRWATTEIAKAHGSSQIGNINKGARELTA